ncbi:hypothetical protein KCP74_01905 [Salmonella enterica subsp. enterica]|nr:hypothetical protein KCP74_01905 [Salmonella enterica subsp. enterica]
MRLAESQAKQVHIAEDRGNCRLARGDSNIQHAVIAINKRAVFMLCGIDWREYMSFQRRRECTVPTVSVSFTPVLIPCLLSACLMVDLRAKGVRADNFMKRFTIMR